MEKTEAIVLGATPYSETSLVVRLLSREFGAVRVLAKGARRPSSRLHGVLEPFGRVSAMLSVPAGDRLGTLGETTLAEGWPYLRADVTRLAWAGLGVELLGRLAEASAPDPFYYEEACRFLATLGVVRGAGSLAIALMLRLLHQSGFAPEPPGPAPAGCEAWVYDFASATFAPAGPGMPAQTFMLPAAALDAIRPALAEPPPLADALLIPRPAGPPLVRWLARVWEDHLNVRLRAMDFLEEMVLAAPPGR